MATKNIKKPATVTTSASSAGEVPEELAVIPNTSVSERNPIGGTPTGPVLTAADKAGADQVALKKQENIGAAIGAVGQLVGGVIQNKQNTNFADYSQQMSNWLAEGKYWMDPNSDLQPDLESYMAEMPNAEKALIGGDTTTNTLMTSFKRSNEMAGAGATVGTSFGPIGTAVGAIVGGVVGGIVGAVEGVFGGKAAKEQDRTARAEILRRYQRSLKEWETRRNKRIRDFNTQYAQYQTGKKLALSNTIAEGKIAQKAAKAAGIAARRNQLVDVIMNLQNSQQNNVNRRMAIGRAYS